MSIVTRMESPANGRCDECGCRFDEGFKLHFAATFITRFLCALCLLHLGLSIEELNLSAEEIAS